MCHVEVRGLRKEHFRLQVSGQRPGRDGVSLAHRALPAHRAHQQHRNDVSVTHSSQHLDT